MNRQRFFDEHYLNIDVVVGRTRKPLGELKCIGKGTVIEFDRLLGEPLDVIVDSEFFGVGEAVTIDDNFGIRITELADNETEETNDSKGECSEKNESNNENKSSQSEETFQKEIENPNDRENKSKHNVVLNQDEIDELLKAISQKNGSAEKSNEKAAGCNSKISQDEIDDILRAIASGEVPDDFHETVRDTRKIKIYDFMHPIKIDRYQMEIISGFMQKLCTFIPGIFDAQLSFTLESITQIPGYDCYKSSKLSFIDQWKWFSSDTYVELGFDDAALKKIFPVKKQGNFYSKKELAELSKKISFPLVTLLSNAFENFSVSPEIPKMSHAHSAPTPEFLLNSNCEKDCNFNSMFFINRNHSMYVSAKIRVQSLDGQNSSGFIYLNIPADDLQNFINLNYHYNQNFEKKSNLDEVIITIDARLGSTKRPVSQIMEIGEGTILELDRLTGEPVDVRANGTPIARGEIIDIDYNFGAKITEIL